MNLNDKNYFQKNFHPIEGMNIIEAAHKFSLCGFGSEIPINCFVVVEKGMSEAFHQIKAINNCSFIDYDIP